MSVIGGGNIPNVDQRVIVVDDFQAEDWVEKGSNTGTLSYDTSDFMAGAKSLKYVTAGSGTPQRDEIYKAVGFTLPGASHNCVELDLKVTGSENVTRLYISLFTSIASNAYYNCNFESTGRKYSSDSTWETTRIPLSSFTASNGASGSQIERIRIIMSDDGTPITVNLNTIRLSSEPVKAYALFTFDDSNASTHDKAAPIMAKYGLKGTSYNIEQNIGFSGQYMTEADVINLEHQGWCNALHGQSPNADGWGNLTEQELDDYLTASITYWTGLGISSGNDIVSYPNGNYGGSKTSYIYKTVKKYCRLGRVTVTQFDAPLRPSDLLRVTVGGFYMRASNTATEINANVDEVVTKGGIAVFVAHDIVDSSATGNEFLTAEFTAVVEHVASLQASGDIDVLTM